jgi:hypothetical protein
MKIIEAINRLDAQKANTYNQPEKIDWLSRLDSMVKKQIIDTHEGSEAVSFEGYTEDTPPDTVLLVPAPYDEVYLRWMEAQIDYHNHEYDSYNNAIIMFNTAFEAYAAHYNQHHIPVSRGQRFLF